MLNNILNLKGVKILNKNQQRFIAGGGGFNCTVTIDGNQSYLYTFSDDEGSSIEANDFCVDIIINTSVSSCSYNCNHDGMA